jgi:hypothetical protein
VVKARRALDVAMGLWKQSPTADRLAVAERARADQRVAQDQLRELCLQDEGMIAAAIRKAS